MPLFSNSFIFRLKQNGWVVCHFYFRNNKPTRIDFCKGTPKNVKELIKKLINDTLNYNNSKNGYIPIIAFNKNHKTTLSISIRNRSGKVHF
jgi:hypothetical protein